MSIRPLARGVASWLASGIASGLLAFSLSAHAAPISVASVSATDSYSGNLSNLTDGIFPADYTLWNDPAMVAWTGTSTALVFDLGSLHSLEDLTLTVDNNDFYFLQVSTNGTLWNALATVLAFDGPVTSGMDTFSSDSSASDYSAFIDFQPQLARYVRLSAIGGDSFYSVGEVSFNGVTAVPEPGAVALTLIGAGVATVAARRRRQA